MAKLRKQLTQCVSMGILTASLLFTAELILHSSNLYDWNVTDSKQSTTMVPEPGKPEIPVIYVVTPTHARLEQKADLTRFSNTLRLVPNLHWILIEDSVNKTTLVANFLRDSKLTFTHLNSATPTDMKIKKGESHFKHPRGVGQRNAGISWIRKNVHTPGVVYFADDDNAYDVRIFEEMRYTKKVSVWPVGLVADQKFESPLVRNGTVRGWLVTFGRNRKFGTDMAGFAINAKLFRNNPKAIFRNKPGYIETDLISQLNITLKDLEPKADNCTKVLVWHTKTSRPSLAQENNFLKLYKHISNRPNEV